MKKQNGNDVENEITLMEQFPINEIAMNHGLNKVIHKNLEKYLENMK